MIEIDIEIKPQRVLLLMFVNIVILIQRGN